MSDSLSWRPFVVDALREAGASVSESDSLLWVQVPEPVRERLDGPARFAMTFDPERVRQFDAELIAPGSYLLEKILSLAMGRGRWDVARFEAPEANWVEEALAGSGLAPQVGLRCEVLGMEDQLLLLFSFRTSLVADEKREEFHMVAVAPSIGAAWRHDSGDSEAGLTPAPDLAPPDLGPAYGLATGILRDTTRESVDRFRATNLQLLEEEVRRIFGYFDQTTAEIRAADPGGSEDLLRAIRAERDRRLTETLERFDPKAKATLCAIRAIVAPMARVRLRFSNQTLGDVTVDAWSRHLNGLTCDFCGGTEGPWSLQDRGVRCGRCPPMRAESVPPRGRPRSDTPRRGTRAARGSGRSPARSTARPRGASARRRRP